MKTPMELATRLFLRQLFSTPRGRAYFYAQLADLEGADEVGLLKRIERVADETLLRMMRRHVADEAKHKALLEALIVETGEPRPQLPSRLNHLRRLEQTLGLFSAPLETRADAVRAYALIQVLEERACRQLALFADVLREFDATGARVLEGIRADEARHVRYCRAITQRLAERPEHLAALLTQFRAVEAQANDETNHASLLYVIDRKILNASAPMRAWWVFASTLATMLRCRPERKGATWGFQRSSHHEPHRARRQKLLSEHPQIRQLFGFDRRTIAVTLGVATTQLGIAAALAGAFAPLWVTAVVAYGFGAILSHWLGQSIHETSHNLAARSRLANRATAWLANTFMALPIAESFHRYHLEHHLHLGVEGRDQDLPLPWETRNITGPWRKAVWLALYPLAYFARGAVEARKRGVSRAEVLNAVWVIGVNVAVWKLLGPTALLYLALSTYFGHGPHPVAAHFIHEHFLFEGDQETFSYDGPLNWVTFHVGYHVEHHDFMNIPGWRLPEYRALVGNGAYRDWVRHHSWTRVLLEFIGRDDLSAAARLVRGERTTSYATRPSVASQP
jgi:sphingolipid delta-4 desaturase